MISYSVLEHKKERGIKAGKKTAKNFLTSTCRCIGFGVHFKKKKSFNLHAPSGIDFEMKTIATLSYCELRTHHFISHYPARNNKI